MDKWDRPIAEPQPSCFISGPKSLLHSPFDSWGSLYMILLCMQLCPELGQHLIILIASASVLLKVLLGYLLQMLLHLLVLLTCTAPQCTLHAAHTCRAPAELPLSSITGHAAGD